MQHTCYAESTKFNQFTAIMTTHTSSWNPSVIIALMRTNKQADLDCCMQFVLFLRATVIMSNRLKSSFTSKILKSNVRPTHSGIKSTCFNLNKFVLKYFKTWNVVTLIVKSIC